MRTQKRKQNTPKKYPNKKGQKNPRKLCPECLKQGKNHYLKKSSTQYSLDKKRKTANVLLFCIKCKYVERNEEEINKIPD